MTESALSYAQACYDVAKAVHGCLQAVGPDVRPAERGMDTAIAIALRPDQHGHAHSLSGVLCDATVPLRELLGNSPHAAMLEALTRELLAVEIVKDFAARRSIFSQDGEQPSQSDYKELARAGKDANSAVATLCRAVEDKRTASWLKQRRDDVHEPLGVVAKLLSRLRSSGVVIVQRDLGWAALQYALPPYTAPGSAIAACDLIMTTFPAYLARQDRLPTPRSDPASLVRSSGGSLVTAGLTGWDL